MISHQTGFLTWYIHGLHLPWAIAAIAKHSSHSQLARKMRAHRHWKSRWTPDPFCPTGAAPVSSAVSVGCRFPSPRGSIGKYRMPPAGGNNESIPAVKMYKKYNPFSHNIFPKKFYLACELTISISPSTARQRRMNIAHVLIFFHHPSQVPTKPHTRQSTVQGLYHAT